MPMGRSLVLGSPSPAAASRLGLRAVAIRIGSPFAPASGLPPPRAFFFHRPLHIRPRSSGALPLLPLHCAPPLLSPSTCHPALHHPHHPRPRSHPWLSPFPPTLLTPPWPPWDDGAAWPHPGSPLSSPAQPLPSSFPRLPTAHRAHPTFPVFHHAIIAVPPPLLDLFPSALLRWAAGAIPAFRRRTAAKALDRGGERQLLE